MNHAENAKKLQEERLERERLEQERQASEKQQADEKRRKMAEVAKEKIQELVRLLLQFDKFKIRNGHVTLEAEANYPVGGDPTAFLKAGSVGLSAMHECPPGTVLLTAHYDAETETYHLNRHQARPRVAGSSINVGKYKSANELMDAVSEEVSKL